MGYWEQADQPFYYSLASAFPIADRYFCSVLGQTYPNRRYLMAATSIGQVDDTLPAQTDYPANGTIFDRLDAHGITWKDYYTNLATRRAASRSSTSRTWARRSSPSPSSSPTRRPARCPASAWSSRTTARQSEENPQNIAVGEEFAASVINAVMAGPGLGRTLLIWTYDEHGGYYDHVPPPPAVPPDDIPPAGARPGSRPTTDSPGTGSGCRARSCRPGPGRDYVSHQVFDHTSICKLVETKWNLPAMTYRDANADRHAGHAGPAGGPAFRTPPPLAPPLLDTDPGALACNATGPGMIPPPGSVTGPAAVPAG